jgi:hypothetical protein
MAWCILQARGVRCCVLSQLDKGMHGWHGTAKSNLMVEAGCLDNRLLASICTLLLGPTFSEVSERQRVAHLACAVAPDRVVPAMTQHAQCVAAPACKAVRSVARD